MREEKTYWDANRKTDRKDSPRCAVNGENDDPSRALFKEASVAAKEAGFQMLADNIATTHPFVREEPCETEQAPVAYFVAAQRLHKLQGQREKLVNQLVGNEERRKDLVKRLDETPRLEVLAQDELDQALARQRNNTTPDSLDIPVLSQKDLAILDDTEQQDYLAAVEADKGFKAHLGATTARTEMHRDKSQAAQASKKEEPQQKKPRWAAEQAMEVDGSDEGSKASEAYRTKVAAHTLQTTRSVKKQWRRRNKHAETRHLNNRLRSHFRGQFNCTNYGVAAYGFVDCAQFDATGLFEHHLQATSCDVERTRLLTFGWRWT